MGKTTFPTVRYYLTLEQELTSAGVKYEYIEAGEVMDFAGYHRAVSRALDGVATDGVDAVVSSDIGAAFCVREALSRGISIPDELQVVAYDGTYLTDLAGMKLTAVAQDFSAIAQSAADHMVQAIANEEAAAANASRKNIPAVRAERAYSHDAGARRYHALMLRVGTLGWGRTVWAA